MYPILAVALSLFSTPILAQSPFANVTPQQWAALNTTVEGRLGIGIPVSRPCYSLAETGGSQNDIQCKIVQQGYNSNVFRASQFGAYQNTQWETCQATQETCILNGFNPTDPSPSSPPRVCKIGSVSGYYVDVRKPKDIQVAFEFSKKTGVPLVIKNTGHDYKGRSSAPHSLALWMRNLQGLSYNPTFTPDGCPKSKSKPAVTIGAGVTFDAIYNFAEANNITVAGGSDRAVGASGGWVQGGHGALSNTLGLGVDRVLQFKLVTPTGQYLTANACQNKDLFWALRGGGGGTFGVVLESTQLASPRVVVQAFFMKFSKNETSTRGHYSVIVDNSLKWAGEGWGGFVEPTQALYVTPKLNKTQAIASMKPLADYAASLAPFDPAVQILNVEIPSFNIFFNTFIGPSGAPVGQNAVVASRFIPTDNFQTPELRAQLVQALMSALATATFDLSLLVTTPISFRPEESEGFTKDDGSVFPSDDDSYSRGNGRTSTSINPIWRKSIFQAVTEGGWAWNATLAEQKQQYELVSKAADFLRAITPPGSYQNEADVNEPNHEVSFWGNNYPELLRIKNKYDPHHLLDCWHCVGFDRNSPRFSCYI